MIYEQHPRIAAFYTSLGRRIQERRTLLRVTQAELGATVTPTVSRASISNIETGRQAVLAHQLVAFATALNTTARELCEPVVPTPQHSDPPKKGLR